MAQGLASPSPEAIRAEANKNVDYLKVTNGRTTIEPNGSHATSPPIPPGAMTPRTRRNSKVGISSLYRADLPKLPVPSLKDSMDRYIRALEGLQDHDEHEETKAIVKEFLESGEGDKWQQRLEEYAAGVDSYIEEFWCEYCIALHDGGGGGGGGGITNAWSACPGDDRPALRVRRPVARPRVM